jgi:hypothetical protein
MPITQNRMHQLLLAAETYRTSCHSIYRLFDSYAEQIRVGKLTKEEAFDKLYFQIHTVALSTDAMAVIIKERAEYDHTRKHNDWQRRHQELKRRMAGAKKQERSPEPSLMPDASLLADTEFDEPIDLDSDLTPSQQAEYAAWKAKRDAGE